MYKKLISAVLIVAMVISGGWWYWYRHNQLPMMLDTLVGMNNVIPVAIIGSGPAGLSAALYTARLGYHTVVFEGQIPGGQLTETTYVENWPGVGKVLGAELMKRERAYVASLGALLMPDTIVNIDLKRWPFTLHTDDGRTMHALSIIIATGSAPRVLDVIGEREYWGKGVTTCALCDAPYYKGKRVVVVGGGDTALEQVTQLAPYAQHITVLVRKGQLRASAALRERVRALPHVSMIFNHKVVQIIGDGTAVTGVQIRDAQSGKQRVLSIDGVFLAIGHEPRTALVAQQLACDGQKNIIVHGRTQCTSVRGVFAAGEVADSVYRQAGVAAGDGIKAAIDASRFLTDIGWTDRRRREFGVQFFVLQQAAKAETNLTNIHSVQEFEQILVADKPVVVDFYAPHCPSCMHMLPAFESVAQHFASDARFVKVDTTQVPALEQQFKVERIPCFIVFKYGQPVARYYAIMTKAQMMDMVQRVL